MGHQLITGVGRILCGAAVGGAAFPPAYCNGEGTGKQDQGLPGGKSSWGWAAHMRQAAGLELPYACPAAMAGVLVC